MFSCNCSLRLALPLLCHRPCGLGFTRLSPLQIGYDVFDFVPFSIYLKGCVEGVLDKCASTEALQTSHESATEKFLACDKEDVLAYRLARGKMERYSNALISRGVSVTMLNETELAQRQEQRASSGDLRASASPRDMIVKATKKAGYNAFNKVVDRNQPLPSVNHAEMFFIMGTTIVTGPCPRLSVCRRRLRADASRTPYSAVL